MDALTLVENLGVLNDSSCLLLTASLPSVLVSSVVFPPPLPPPFSSPRTSPPLEVCVTVVHQLLDGLLLDTEVR